MPTVAAAAREFLFAFFPRQEFSFVSAIVWGTADAANARRAWT